MRGHPEGHGHAAATPVRVLPPDDHDGIRAVRKNLDLPGYVFGLDRPAEGERLMPVVSERFGRGLGRHSNDQQK